MIEIIITPTMKSYSPKAEWERHQDYTAGSFPNLETAKKFLTDKYGKCKRQPMFSDTKDGKTIQSGYVFHFRDSYGSQKWLQQDWVSFRECKTLNLA